MFEKRKSVSKEMLATEDNRMKLLNTNFTFKGSARPLSLCYFDIPSINDRSIQSDEIFAALN